jgi:hypothetical protein
LNRKEKETFVYEGHAALEDDIDLEDLFNYVESLSDAALDVEVNWIDHLLDK